MNHQDKTLSPKERAKALLSIMNLDEKIAQMQCFYIQDFIDQNGRFADDGKIGAAGVGGLAFERVIMPHSVAQEVNIVNEIKTYFKQNTRLGIPPFIHAEALHGLCLKGTTSFPQAIGLSAMWDTNTMAAVSNVIANECRSRGINQVLSPTVDMARDLRWGRVEETYGEDATLTSEMAVAFCKQFEDQRIVTTLKHFVANSGDAGRDSAPVYHSERLLKNYYFKPYKACIQRAGSRSVMASYNALNSVPSGLNKWLLDDMLRQYMGFEGFVVTDYGLMNKAQNLHKISPDMCEIAAKAIQAGLHREIPEPEGYRYVKQALDMQYITEEDIDQLVLDILKVKFELGLFDEDNNLSPEYAEELCDCSTHREVAYEAAKKSIVMLKNDGVLPLQENSKTAIVGSIANHPRLGGYSTWDIEVKSLTDVMKKADYVAFADQAQEQKFCCIDQAYFWHLGDSGLEQGIKGFYKDNKEYCFAPVLERNDGAIDFDWSDKAVDENGILGKGKEFSVEWHGFIQVPKTGNYTFCIEANGGISLNIDGQVLIDRFFDTVSDRQTACYDLEANKQYAITVGFSTSGTNPSIRLCWNYDEHKNIAPIDYKAALQGYDNVIVTAGVTEGEGSDRANLDLPQSVEKLILDLCDTGKKVIVVVYAGSAVTMQKWIDRVDGVLYVWYPGQEGSRAICDVLYGRYNPAGRLPITFPRSVAQAPIYYNPEPRGRNSGYNDMTDKPQFAFGYGLSYTSFAYHNLTVSSKQIYENKPVLVSVDVTNSGTCDGDEVVQLYVNDLYSSVATPEKQLVAFVRIHILCGETKTVQFEIQPDDLRLLDENNEWRLEKGDFELMVGSSSDDIRLSTCITY